jgi:protein-disulfide isomerase
MLRELYRTRDTWTRIKDPTNYFIGSAVRVKLDIRQFMECQKGDSSEAVIARAGEEASRFHIEKAPTTIVDGRAIIGAVGLDELKRSAEHGQ